MEELALSYYFEHLEKIIFQPAFESVAYPWEALKIKNEKLFQFTKSNILGKVHQSAVITGLVQIGQGVVIEPYAVIEGPVIIGENTLVRSHALIRPYSAIGRNCVIGHDSEIKNALVMDQAKVASFCFVGDSILGYGARLGSGTITENRRFDQKEIAFKAKEEIFKTGSDKMGCVIGDYARTGGGVLIAPGTLIGKYAWIYSDTSVFGFVPKESLVKLRQVVEVVRKERVILGPLDKQGKV